LSEAGSDASTLRDYLQVARRRKWVILMALVLVPGGAVALSLEQERLYEASAEVLLSQQNLGAALTGTDDPNAGQQPDRLAQTQASLARVPSIAASVLRETGLRDRSPEELLSASSVSARPNTDLLVFEVTDPDPAMASLLATEYARQFTQYRLELDTSALVRARKEVAGQIARLKARGERKSALYVSLVDKEQQLRTMEALRTSNALVVRTAGEAAQVQPKPVRNGVLGLVLGLVLGIGLAFLWEALDTRLRSAEDIGRALDLPLLARLSAPPRKLRKNHKLAMLADVASGHAEAYRVLRTNVEFANLDRGAQTIMITSAVEGEGKSTTAANLAIAFARAGRRVLLLDLDLRRPFLDRFFGLEEEPGLTDAALGHVELNRAVARVALGAGGKGALTEDGNGTGSIQGVLEVVPSGPVPPDPGEFVASRAFSVQLDSLRQRADIVLIDSPPLLHVGDALALSAFVDALIVVTRLDIIRRPMLGELRRALDATRAVKLGFVLTGANLEEGYAQAYGYSRAYRYTREAEPERVR
jgi:Mrp family chromosome partitioning ATPase/capsular polysaccharide biosynthesis protein